MGSGAVVRHTFGKRDAGDVSEALPSGGHAGGGHGVPGGSDRPMPRASTGLDLHPQQVRRSHSLSEIF